MKTQITLKKKKKLSMKGSTPPDEAAEGTPAEDQPAAPAGPGVVAQVGSGAPSMFIPPSADDFAPPPAKLTIYAVFSLISFILFTALLILQYMEFDFFVNQPEPAFPPMP